MHSLNIKTLPNYLQKSDYITNNTDMIDDGNIIVLKKYIIELNKSNQINISNKQQFISVLDKLRYWMVNRLPFEIYDYLFSQTDVSLVTEDDILMFKDFYYEELEAIIKNRNESKLIIMNKAAEIDSFNLIQYLHEHDYEWDESTVTQVFHHDNIETVKYLHKNGCKFPQYSSEYISNNDGIKCWEFAYQLGLIEWDSQTFYYAALLGELDLLQFAVKHNKEINDRVISAAISLDAKLTSGIKFRKPATEKELVELTMNMLKFIHENVCGLNDKSLCNKQFCEHTPWNQETMRIAAEHGNLEAVKYLREHGCSHDHAAVNSAVIRNRSIVLKYLLKNGYQCDEYTCMYAAENGSLECLKIVHEHKCLMDWKCIHFSARNGYLCTLKYAYENGCDYNKHNTHLSSPCYGAVTNISHSKKFDLGDQHLECLKYCIEIIKCPPEKKLMMLAAKFDNLEALKYLHSLYKQNNTLLNYDKTIMLEAELNNNTECIKYLTENNFPQPTPKEVHDAKIKKEINKPIIMTRSNN